MYNFIIRYYVFGQLRELQFNGPDYYRLEQFVMDCETDCCCFKDGWYIDHEGFRLEQFDYDHLQVLLQLMDMEEGRDI